MSKVRTNDGCIRRCGGIYSRARNFYKSRIPASLDYIVSVESDVFHRILEIWLKAVSLPSYFGNMARAVEGHRCFLGHRKTISPGRKAIVLQFDKLEQGKYKRRGKSGQSNYWNRPKKARISKDETRSCFRDEGYGSVLFRGSLLCELIARLFVERRTTDQKHISDFLLIVWKDPK